LVFVHLITLFAAALVCHQQLAARRPAPQHLTRFYFWMALGGVAGGMFNALIAPAVFDSVMEYPLGLVAVSLLLPATRAGVSERRPNWTDL
ncbi:MAG: spermidine synthase, partial [Planctomycetales bacterium]|nr:spermidine synthase [Planctomycetales bacterium]